jgi:hypothetical protein
MTVDRLPVPLVGWQVFCGTYFIIARQAGKGLNNSKKVALSTNIGCFPRVLAHPWHLRSLR